MSPGNSTLFCFRLAVDLTPDEEYCFHGDRDAEDTGNDNITTHDDVHSTGHDDNRRKNFGNNNSASRQEHSGTTGGGGNAVTCSSGRGHVCNWYSRQNTSDKTAKDIYNHEHFLTDSKQYNALALDSEFKRHLEEEGNDFKDVKLYDETDCDKLRKSSSPVGMQTNEEDDDDDSITKDDDDEVFVALSDVNKIPATPTSKHPKRDSPCYADAELSSCFPDAHHSGLQVRETCSRFLTSLPQTGLHGHHKPLAKNASTEDKSNNNNNNNNCNSNNSRETTRNCLDLEQELRRAAREDGVGADVEDDIDNGDFDDEDDDDDDVSLEFALSNVDLPEAPPELPVDMDEDVDEGMEVWLWLFYVRNL